MPRYKKKITRLMDFKEFEDGSLTEEDPLRRSLLGLLYLSGCRVSEALTLKPSDLSKFGTTLFVEFYRLKGSKQTEPQELPYTVNLQPLFNRALHMAYTDKPIFPFSYKTAYRIVKKAFPKFYPHYFRMNWITITVRELGDSYAVSTLGLSSRALDFYRGKVSLTRVKDMWTNLIKQ